MAQTARQKTEEKLRKLEEQERAIIMRRQEMAKKLEEEIDKEETEAKFRVGTVALSCQPELQAMTEAELTDLFKKVFSQAESSLPNPVIESPD